MENKPEYSKHSDIWNDKHQTIESRLSSTEKKVEILDDRLNEVEIRQATMEIRISHLIEELEKLNGNIKWFGRILISTLLAFMIWYIQNIGR